MIKTIICRRQAQALHASGVEVIAVGIGNSVSNSELEAIASDTSHVFQVQDFDLLSTIQNQLTNAACQQAALRKCCYTVQTTITTTFFFFFFFSFFFFFFFFVVVVVVIEFVRVKHFFVGQP